MLARAPVSVRSYKAAPQRVYTPSISVSARLTRSVPTQSVARSVQQIRSFAAERKRLELPDTRKPVETIVDTGAFLIRSDSPAYMGVPNEPIDMINSVPPIEIEENRAVCDGAADRATGHPRIFIQLAEDGTPNTCGYCGLRFAYKPKHHGHHNPFSDYKHTA